MRCRSSFRPIDRSKRRALSDTFPVLRTFACERNRDSRCASRSSTIPWPIPSVSSNTRRESRRLKRLLFFVFVCHETNHRFRGKISSFRHHHLALLIPSVISTCSRAMRMKCTQSHVSTRLLLKSGAANGPGARWRRKKKSSFLFIILTA